MARIDEKYIENLQNFSASLENIVELMKNQQKEQDTTTDVVNQFLKNFDAAKISKIVEDLDTINKTSKTTLSNTEKILAEVKAIKAQKESGGFGSIADPANKNKIIDGVKIITIIAGGVLAIGLAFKLISPVDAASVLVLGVAIAAMSYSFAKIIEIPGLTFKNVLLASIVLPMMAAGIMFSSWLLTAVSPVSPAQLLSIVAISIGLGLAAGHIIKAAHHIKAGDFAKYMMLPVIFIAISTALVVSSYILNGIAPITFGVFVSVLGYSILLIPLAFAFGILVSLIGGKSQKMGGADSRLASFMGGGGISMADMMKASLIIPIVAGVLVASSWILQAIAPINLNIFLSVLGYSIALLPMVFIFSVVATMVSKGMNGFMGIPINSSGMSWSDILKTSVMVLAIASTFVGVSMILQSFQPLQDPMGLIVAVVSIGASIVIGGLALWAISKLGGPSTMLQGAIAALIISGTIMASSQILSMGDYKTYPSLDWVIGAGAAVGVFGAMMAVSGALLVASFGVGFVALAAGAAAMLVVAAALVGVGEIIGQGSWNSWQYPSLDWVKGVGGALMVFVYAMDKIGGGIASTLMTSLFGGKSETEKFQDFIVGVSETLLLSGEIIGKGKWKSWEYPSQEWAMGVGCAILLFARALAVINLIEGISSLFGQNKDFNQFVIETSFTMAKAGEIIGKTQWNTLTHPTEEWAKGVGNSIYLFAKAMAVISMIEGISSMLGQKKDFNQFVLETCKTMNEAGNIIGAGNWDKLKGKYPSEEWAKGVGLSLTYFAEVMGKIFKMDIIGGILGGGKQTDLKSFMVYAAQALILVGSLFEKYGGVFDTSKVPSKEWSDGIKNSLQMFVDMLTKMNKLTGTFSDMNDENGPIYNIKAMTIGLITIGGYFTKYNKDGKLFDPSLVPGDMWSKSVSNALDAMTNQKGIKGLNDFISALERVKELGNIQSPLIQLSVSIDRLAKSMSNFSTMGLKKLSTLAQTFTMLGLIDQVKLSSVIKTIEERKAKVEAIHDDKGFMAGLLQTMGANAQRQSGPLVGSTVKGSGVGTKDESMDKLVMLVEMIQKDVQSLANKDAEAEETEGVSAPGNVAG